MLREDDDTDDIQQALAHNDMMALDELRDYILYKDDDGVIHKALHT